MSLAQGNNTPTRPRNEPGSTNPEYDALTTRPVPLLADKYYSLITGDITIKLSEKMNRKRQWNRQKQKTTAFKKRRIHLKEQKRNTQTLSTVKEGDTYKTNLEMCTDVSMKQIPSPLQFKESDSFLT